MPCPSRSPDDQRDRALRRAFDKIVAQRMNELDHVDYIVAARNLVREEERKNMERDLRDPRLAQAHARVADSDAREAAALASRYERFLDAAKWDGRKRYYEHMSSLGVLSSAATDDEEGAASSWVVDAIGIVVLLALSCAVAIQRRRARLSSSSVQRRSEPPQQQQRLRTNVC